MFKLLLSPFKRPSTTSQPDGSTNQQEDDRTDKSPSPIVSNNIDMESPQNAVTEDAVAEDVIASGSESPASTGPPESGPETGDVAEAPIVKRGRGRPPKNGAKSNGTPSKVENKPPGRRGRPPKAVKTIPAGDDADQPAIEENGQHAISTDQFYGGQSSAAETNGSTEPKKGRGRPPKENKSTNDAETKTNGAKKRGRPPKAAKTASDTEAKPNGGKKRGRKPKAKTNDDEPTVNDDGDHGDEDGEASPAKQPKPTTSEMGENVVKRGRGRPKKAETVTIENEDPIDTE